jgi:leader peptidase (prepilin peptidase)/N-methyltransferase
VPALVLDVYAGLLGLVVGSFLNVVVHRLPRGQSLVRPRSRCPWCGAPIRALDNLPVLSFILLRGRCRHCTGPISWRYPLMEILTAALFVLSLERFGPGWAAVAGAVFSALLLALAAIDLEHFLLPDSLTLPGIAVGLALRAAASRPDWISGLASGAAGALVGAGLLFLVAETWLWLRGEEGMGLGDAKLLAMIGAFLGWAGVAVGFVVACALGAAMGLALLAAQRAGRKTRLPFGVFLAVGGLVALHAGTMLVDRYLALLQ